MFVIVASLLCLSLARGEGVESVQQVGEVKYGVFLESLEHVMKRQTYESLRMSFYYDDSIENSMNLAQDVEDRIKNAIVPELKTFIESTLSVKRTGAPILIDRSCTGNTFFPSNEAEAIQCETTCSDQTMCGPSIVPEDHLKECIECNGDFTQCAPRNGTSNGLGVDADFLLYVSAITTDTCQNTATLVPSTVAFASACAMESALDRPIAGSMNFCPAALSGDIDNDFLLDVVKHEILHALGFSVALYPFWRNKTGHPRSARDEYGHPFIENGQFVISNTTIQEVTYNDWRTQNETVSHTVNLLVTPRVVETARAHFNCPTLAGVELENQGGEGTMLSHWEKRILGNELMTGLLTDNPILSSLTLALLEDSGWYSVNTSGAKELLWGKDAGCEFPQGSCFQYLQENSTQSPPFCTGSQLGCTVDQLFVGSCGIAQYSQLPAEYQYFSDPQMGGIVEISDYCPFYKSFTFTGTTRGTECSNENNQPSDDMNVNAETYGSNARCFQHNNRWSANGDTFDLYGAGCYTYSCDENATVLTINIGDTPYQCTEPGQVISIDVNYNGIRYIGEILCPSLFESLCEEVAPTDIDSTDQTDPTDANPTSSTDRVFPSVCVITITIITYLVVIVQ